MLLSLTTDVITLNICMEMVIIRMSYGRSGLSLQFQIVQIVRFGVVCLV